MSPRPYEPFEETLRRAVGWTASRATLRASDAEREAIADVLRRAHAEGRLDTSELEERLASCYGAKTLGELDRLVHDLPAPRVERAPAPRGMPWPVQAFAFFALVALLVSLAIGSHGFVIWPFFLFFVFLRFGRRRRWRSYL